MRVAILGYGVEGRAAFGYWDKPGNEITVCDKSTDVNLPDGVKSQLGPDYLKNLGDFDLIVRSPNLHPRDLDPSYLGKVTTNTNEFFRVCPSKHIIGVTGTKGKGTTSTLIAKMLEAAGKKVHLGGNIGIAPLELLKNNIEAKDWVVLELSNFQLIDVKSSPHIGVVLMVEPEHMDWHTDMPEYTNAKQQMFAHQTANDFAIYYGKNENSKKVAEASPGSLVPYMRSPGAEVIDGKITIGGQTICETSELKLPGQHNWQNACAAVTALWQIEQNVSAAQGVLTNFSGLPFRIELRREINGVRYYNDSYASQPKATIAAINSIDGLKVVIVGGFERMLDLSRLAKDIKDSEKEIRKVVVIGESGARVAESLEEAGFNNYELSSLKTMDEIVKLAGSFAEQGDAVVLSPGFASFDMFKNFEVRGQKFNEAVEKL